MSTQSTIRDAAEYPNIAASDYVILGPHGTVLKVSREVYEALAMFIGMQGEVRNGVVTINCNRGNIAGVTAEIKLK